jgi:hypothetical protein
MRWDVFWIAAILILSTVFFSGCTQTHETTINEGATITPTLMTIATATPTPSPTMTTVQTTVIPTETPVPQFTPEEPMWTPTPVVVPTASTDWSSYNFTQFVDDDFMAKVPAEWATTCQTFQLSDTTLYNMDIWKRDGRLVTFSSEDGKTKMMVTVWDFISPGPNRYTFTPTIDSARKSVATLFPNASSETSVFNYKYTKNDQQIFTSSYDVMFNPDSEYYPYTYTEETWTTYNHLFNVDFIVINGLKLEDYRDLKYYMIKNVLTEGNQQRKFW